MTKLKEWLRRWLGIDILQYRISGLDAQYKNCVAIGIDAHFRQESMIIIASRLKGGQIRIIDCQFNSMRDMEELVKRLQHEYNTTRIYADLPHEYRPYFMRDSL